jgi:hypothetical protein
MAWILRTLWSGLWSRLSGSPSDGAGAQVSGVHALGACAPPPDRQTKRFYSLTIEVRPEEADAETLLLFSDGACFSLSATLNLPAGCELRCCMDMSPDLAEVLIRM